MTPGRSSGVLRGNTRGRDHLHLEKSVSNVPPALTENDQTQFASALQVSLAKVMRFAWRVKRWRVTGSLTFTPAITVDNTPCTVNLDFPVVNIMRSAPGEPLREAPDERYVPFSLHGPSVAPDDADSYKLRFGTNFLMAGASVLDTPPPEEGLRPRYMIPEAGPNWQAIVWGDYYAATIQTGGMFNTGDKFLVASREHIPSLVLPSIIMPFWRKNSYNHIGFNGYDALQLQFGPLRGPSVLQYVDEPAGNFTIKPTNNAADDVEIPVRLRLSGSYGTYDIGGGYPSPPGPSYVTYSGASSNLIMRPQVYWEYARKDGTPVYDPTTGEQIADPFG